MDKSEQGQVSVASVRERARRRYAREEKLAIVGECLQPGASLAGVALAHQAIANMVRKWVVKYQRGGFGAVDDGAPAMLPVVVGRRPAAGTAMKSAAPTPALEIEMPRGSVRIYGTPDAALVEAVIAALAR